MDRDLTVGHVGLVIDTFAAVGDYLRTHGLITGCGFEQADSGVVCYYQNCRFANTAHDIAERGAVCAQCPIFELTKEALQSRGHHLVLREHAILAAGDVTCVFHLSLEPAAAEGERVTDPDLG